MLGKIQMLKHKIRLTVFYFNKGSFRACLNFVWFLSDASFISIKTWDVRASFIGMKYKNKI